MAAIQRKPQLRPKREAFAKFYAEHHNATLAAIQAGYSKKNAHNTGSRLANDKQLQERINAYGQLGLDSLAILTQSNNHIAAVQASKELVERAYGKARSNDADKQRVPSITINLNRIDLTGENIETKPLPIDTNSGGSDTVSR